MIKKQIGISDCEEEEWKNDGVTVWYFIFNSSLRILTPFLSNY
jgi:hypothetical protein